jgi:aminoglycoside phosphotransferase (APT) family kinase protein
VTALEERLARAFPELRVAPLRELATGFHSVAVETADGVVFRIPRYEGTANGHSMELRVLPVIAEHLPVPIPNPEWRIEPGREDFPLGAIGYRKLSGCSPDSGSETLAAGLAGFLAALHSFPLDEAEALGLEAWIDTRAGLLRHRDQVMPALAELLEPDELARIADWWDTLLSGGELERFDPALRHGDPWFGNLLVDDSGALSGVLDWEGLEIGDPAADFAAQVYLGKPFLAAVLGHYRPVDAAFERRVELLALLREFGGVRISLELGDQDELAQSVAKVRAGAILSG